MSKNPYNWQGHRPQHVVQRAGISDRLVSLLLRGEGAVLLGGRGTGKSVLLRQVEERLGQSEGLRRLRIPTPPASLTIESWLNDLARKLGVTPPPGADVEEILETFFQTQNTDRGVVLLIDEVDQYIHPQLSAQFGRALFNNLEAARRELSPRLGVLAAGGLGLYMLKSALGSDFMSRASLLPMEPFGEDEIEEMAKPFAEQGEPLSAAVLATIRLTAGGNPALVTLALEGLWGREESTPRDVEQLFARFRDDHRGFYRSFWSTITDPSLSEVPRALWTEIKRGDGTYKRSELQRACAEAANPARLDLEEALQLLHAAGLVRLQSALGDDPLYLRPIISVLDLPVPEESAADLRQRLGSDLEQTLADIHRCGPDYFHGRGKDRALVPEATFSAVLTAGLAGRGWRVEREAMHGAGRTDLKLRHPSYPGIAIVEVKIWGRNDWEQVHAQVLGYWSVDVQAGSVVMISDNPPADWLGAYEAACLAGSQSERIKHHDGLAGHLVASARTAEGREVTIEHLLLRVPRPARKES